MKLVLIMLVALVVGLMVACGGGSDEYQYPKETAENYVEACVFNAEAAGASGKDSKKYCDCTLKELEREYSLTEFIQIDNQMFEGGMNAAPAKVLEIMETCASTLE